MCLFGDSAPHKQFDADKGIWNNCRQDWLPCAAYSALFPVTMRSRSDDTDAGAAIDSA